MLTPCSSAACAVYIIDEDGKPFFFTKRVYAWQSIEDCEPRAMVMDDDEGTLKPAQEWEGLFIFMEQARIGANSKLGKALIAKWQARKDRKPA